MSLLDTALQSKIKKSQDAQDKAEKQYQATTINNAALKLASQSKDPKDLEMATAVIEAIGAKDPEVSKIVFGNIEKRIKSFEQKSRASEVLDQAQEPGGIQKILAKNPMGIKATQGGVTVDIKPPEDSKGAKKAENQSQAIYRFAQQFDRSYQELKKFDPEIDKIGLGGFLTRKAATVATAIDALPETKALQITVLPMAQQIASELEGGRVTDQDRKIQADKFASAVKFPTKSNIRLLANNYIDLIDKGGDENGKISTQLRTLLERKSDIFNSVIEQVLTEFPEKAKDILGDDYEVVQ